jgi:hypothetical protein
MSEESENPILSEIHGRYVSEHPIVESKIGPVLGTLPWDFDYETVLFSGGYSRFDTFKLIRMVGEEGLPELLGHFTDEDNHAGAAQIELIGTIAVDIGKPIDWSEGAIKQEDGFAKFDVARLRDCVIRWGRDQGYLPEPPDQTPDQSPEQ